MKYVSMVIALVLIVSTGCSHNLTLVNRDQYYSNAPTFEEKKAVGVIAAQSPEQERLVNEVVSGLRSLGNIAVTYPCSPSAQDVDCLLDINIRNTFNGDASNFFVSFPGFLVFAPAWNGYNYSSNITTSVSVTDRHDNNTVSTQTYETVYKCKQSEFDRTWTQGVDWVATWGACSLIGGIVYTNYDDDITNDFVSYYSQPYGLYIARKIGLELQSM